MFTSLLVPLDGSALAQTAVDDAVALAVCTGGKVLLVRVVRPPEFFTKEEAVPPPLGVASANDVALADYGQRKNEASDYLETQKRAILHFGVAVETRVSESHQPADEILRIARGSGADLIVLTAHGAGASSVPPSSGVFGSVCDAVLRHSDLPVLVIKRRSEMRTSDARTRGEPEGEVARLG